MGAAQSSIPTEAAVVGAIVAGGITAYSVYSRNANAPAGSKAGSPPEAKGSGGKKGRGKKKAGTGVETDAEFERVIAAANKENAVAAASARVVRAPEVVPGTFDFNPTSQSESEDREKKARKKKTKKPASGTAGSGEFKSAASSVVSEKSDEPPARAEQVVAPQVVQAEAPPPSASSSKKNKKRKNKAGLTTPVASDLATSFNMSDAGEDASWTRVSTRKKAAVASGTADPAESVTGASSTDAELLTSDTNLTSGATDPDLTETEEEDVGLKKSDTVTRKTLTERMPKPRKTGVEDMEDEPLQPTLARVIAIRPVADEKPAQGFNWGDYEEYAGADESAASGADVSNDDAWEQVSSKKKARVNAPSSSRVASSSDSLSNSYSALSTDDDGSKGKKARQNAEKRDAQKAAKDAAEKDRVERLAKHKKELEKVRMAEQFASGGKKAIGGGMQATVGEGGKLVWE